MLGLAAFSGCAGSSEPVQMTGPIVGAAGTGAAAVAGSGVVQPVVAGSAAAPPTPVPTKTYTIPGPALPCAGKLGMIRGRNPEMVTAAGLNRTFIYYAPATLDPNKPAPVVIIPHGYTMTADQMFEITRYSDLADQEQFIAVFPNGQPSAGGLLDGPWNVGSPDCKSTIFGQLPVAAGDDQAFLDAILSFAETDQCLDRQHVFMAGFSMGGYFSNETGCLRPDIRAVAPHSGGTHELAACASVRKPVLVMHFNPDGLIPYTCGVQARDRWVAKNGCQATEPDITPVTGGSCEYYKGCPVDAQVAFCTFNVPPERMNAQYAGHAWSGGLITTNATFGIPETASASQLSWEFFKKYGW